MPERFNFVCLLEVGDDSGIRPAVMHIIERAFASWLARRSTEVVLIDASAQGSVERWPFTSEDYYVHHQPSGSQILFFYFESADGSDKSMVSISARCSAYAYTVSLPSRAMVSLDISRKLAELYLQLRDTSARPIVAAGVELEADQPRSAIELIKKASKPGSLVEYLCYDNQGDATVASPNFSKVYESGAAVVLKRR
jgi:hypothetical protein